MSVLALIPARAGSKGIPGKNMRRLGGASLIGLAVECAHKADCEVVLSTDIPAVRLVDGWQAPAPKPGDIAREFTYLERPTELATDSASMLSVVQHALAQIPGPDEQIIVLLQPTQPFRTPEHVRAAIALLGDYGQVYTDEYGEPDDSFRDCVHSVVSVVPIPPTHAPPMLCDIKYGYLKPWRAAIRADEAWMATSWQWNHVPTRRQDVTDTYLRRDGTVYVFWRRTIREYESLYGLHSRPLILDPSETCELDTEQQWAEVERRWKEREHVER